MVKRVMFYAIGAVVLVGIYLLYAKMDNDQKKRDAEMNKAIEFMQRAKAQ